MELATRIRVGALVRDARRRRPPRRCRHALPSAPPASTATPVPTPLVAPSRRHITPSPIAPMVADARVAFSFGGAIGIHGDNQDCPPTTPVETGGVGGAPAIAGGGGRRR